MKKITVFLILLGLFCCSIFLRWYQLPSNLFFGPEQGRDMLAIRDIVVNHKLTLIGSKTDIAGIFHGPIFYYLSVLPFVVTEGNPLTVSFFMILIQSIGVWFIYLLGRDITKNIRVGLLAAGLYALSFLGIVYGRWLSNPPLSIPFSLICMWSIVRFLLGERRYLLLTAVSFACLGQAEFINFLLFGGIVCMGAVRFWKNIRSMPIVYIGLVFVLGVALSFGNYLVFDLRHGFLISKSVMGLLHGSSGYSISLTNSAKEALQMFASQFAMICGIITWQVGVVCLIITLFILVVERKKHEYTDLILIWLVAPVLMLIVLRHGVLEQLFGGLVPAMILAIAIVVDWLIRKIPIIGICAGLLVFSVMGYTYINYLPTNAHVFFQSPQPNVRYRDQLEVVDRIYKLANGRSFFFQAYTIPYFWQDAWIYLFWYQGTRRYGYVPKEENLSVIYVIIQKDESDPVYQANWYKQVVSTWGKRTEGFTVGEYTVEIRKKER